MKLDKSEKIQLFYDCIGAFFCALILGTICSMLVNPSSSPQFHHSGWEYFHFFLPFVFYTIFIYSCWNSSALKSFRLSFLWIFINLFCPMGTLIFSFFIRDVVHNSLFTEHSGFVPYGVFLSVIGAACLALVFCAFFFWFFGLMHRTLVENRKRQSVLNLENV